MNFLSIETIAFTVLSYPISYIELVATIFGLLSVYYATQVNVMTWPAGIVNEWGFFFLFYQVNLYADMFLQMVFFVITIYGWYVWRHRKEDGELVRIKLPWLIILIGLILIASALLNVFVKNLHVLFPVIFPQEASHPFADSFVSLTSIVAILLMAKKVVEAWILWIIVDITSIGLFASREIYIVATEYVIFLLMAIYGYYMWRKKIVP